MADSNRTIITRSRGCGWRLLQAIFSILWGIGYLGNGLLFLYIEWSYLHQSFVQAFNPVLQFQVLGTLVTTPLFWFFLVMAVLGYCAAIGIGKQLERSDKRSDLKLGEALSKPPQADQTKQSTVSSSSSVHQRTTDAYVSSHPSFQQVDKSETRHVAQQVKLLEWAIQNSQKVQFSYEKRNGAKSERTLTPTRLKTIEQTLCLEGYCHLSQAKKTFAIERIREAKLISSNEVSYQLDSPQSIATETVHTAAQTQQRLYIKYLFDELEKITESEWSNFKALSEIHHELGFRSRRQAHTLRKRISQRLAQLQDVQFG